MEEETLLEQYLEETMENMKIQLQLDFQRWGETWRHRDIGNQEERIFARFRDYYDQFKNGGDPIPWAKIACLAHIAMIRAAHPELLYEDAEP